MRSASG